MELVSFGIHHADEASTHRHERASPQRTGHENSLTTTRAVPRSARALPGLTAPGPAKRRLVPHESSLIVPRTLLGTWKADKAGARLWALRGTEGLRFSH
jgi:hypothetical protein